MVSNRNKASSLYSNFTAFISYSHVDAAIVKKLHRKIETYVFPKSLRNDYPQLMQMSESGRKIGPIFRDREDLPAGQDLSDSVKAALKKSHSLIIICSPNAKKSPWVAREIEVFRELHPDRPILAAIIDGEPEECFPIPLIADGTEPLAADLRKGGDGRKLGFLKLVAGIANIPLDALIQRDAQRKLRSVMAVTLVAGVSLLAMTMMTIFAFQQRNEAQQQRVAAESLIEYMLTDLRAKLKDVGRLDIMTAVNGRAMDYYDDQGDLRKLSDDSLIRRARVIGKMGEDQQNEGNLALAQRNYLELHKITKSRLANNPSDKKLIYAHAQSENRLALLANVQKDYDTALIHLNRGLKLLTPILIEPIEQTDRLRLAAYMHGNICAVNLQKKVESNQTLSHCRKAAEHNEILIDRKPNDRSLLYDIVFHYSWLSDALRANDLREEEAQYRQKYLDMINYMIGIEPENKHWREQQMEILARHAEILIDDGKNNRALRYISQAREINQSLISHDRQNDFWHNYQIKLDKLKRKVHSNAR